MTDNPFNKWNNDYLRLCKSKKYDDFFKNIKLVDIKPSYHEKFEGIQEQYLRLGYMSPAQAETIEYANKKKPKNGVSPRSFRGLPRVLNEGIY